MKRFIFVILIISLFLILLQKIFEPDTFWHIKTGEIILKTKAIPHKDVFSFVTEGKDWTPPEWLSDVIFYLVYKAGGFVLLNIFFIITYGLCFILLFYILIQRGVTTLISSTIVTVGAIASWERSQARPHIFTYLFMALMILLIDEYRLKGKRYIWFLPLISILWINLHPESAVAVFIFLSIIIMEMIKIYLNKYMPEKYSFLRIEDEQSIGKIITLLIIFFLTLIANFINPQGYRVFDFLFRHPDVITKLEINEFMPLKFADFPKTFLSIVIFMSIALLGIRKNFHEIHLAIGFGFLTFKFRRFLTEFFIFAIPAAGIAIQFYLDVAQNLIKRYAPSFSFRIINGGFTVLYLVLLSYSIHKLYYYDFHSFKGIGLHQKYFPKSAFEFIERNKIRPNVYNSANFGGAMIFYFFPEQKVFEDTRLISYEIMLKYKTSIKKPDFPKIVEFYDVNYTIIDTDLSILSDYPDMRKNWALVYFDDFSEIFVKRTPENEYLYKGKEFLAINPERIEDMVEYSLENSIIPLNAIYEIRRALTLAPDSYKLHYALGALLSQSRGDKNAIAEAKAELKKSLDIMPLYPYANKRMAEILMAEGNYREAIPYFEKLVRCAEFNKWENLSDILNEFGLLHIQVKEYSKAKRIFKRALKVDPKNTAAYENLEALKRGNF